LANNSSSMKNAEDSTRLQALVEILQRPVL
jgi:hypothetical protein